MAKRVTIRDVAKKANTSYQTVSRVVNGKDGVATGTYQRVMDAIQELGYRPHSTSNADWQAAHRTSVLALSFQRPLSELLESAYVRNLIAGIEYVASMQDCRLLFLNASTPAEMTSEHRWLLESDAADGVIVLFHTDDSAVAVLQEADFPVVVQGYSDLAVPTVRSDDENAAFVATQHLLALGHRHIGVISGPKDNRASQARSRGFLHGINSIGLDGEDLPWVEGDYTYEGGLIACERLLTEAPDLTAVFCFNDATAMGAMEYLKTQGYRIPEDISVFGFNNSPEAAHSSPPLTTMGLFPRDFGERAAQMLLAVIDGQRLPEEQVIYAARLVVRETTAAPRR